MKITAVNIPKSINNNDGLDSIKMYKLGDIVLIAGKNGSGKTRILNKVFKALSEKKKEDESKKQTQIDIDLNKRSLIDVENKIKMLENELKNKYDGNIEKELRFNKSYRGNFIDRIHALELEKFSTRIETSETSSQYEAIYFAPKSLDLIDCNTLSRKDMSINAKNIDRIGVEHLPAGTFAKIQTIQNQYFLATHPNSSIHQQEKDLATDNYNRLKDIVRIFLNADIDIDKNGNSTLFGFQLGESNLSEGQKILLQFSLALYSQSDKLKDSILILEEPENHLHPSVIIEVIERIHNYVTNGQLWISTHSIPLISHFNPSYIWYVDNGKIIHAEKKPETVVTSLLGEEEIAKLHDFIGLPSQYATVIYAFESLFDPKSVSTGSDDPQTLQIKADLLSLMGSKSLRILDYGAGKGRLISYIAAINEDSSDKLIDKVDYIAYDKYCEDKVCCESILVNAYGSSDKRYFNNWGDLLSHYNKESFDVVVMCNVLHEVDPKEWLVLFSEGGMVTSLLKDTGILLLVEDHQIPIGEKAYEKGFLVIDTPQIKELFNISEMEVGFLFSDKNGDGRLKSHRIPKKCLTRITEESRIKAIRSLSQHAKQMILEIRGKKDTNYKNGKLHGFWTQQFANAHLNLSEFTSK